MRKHLLLILVTLMLTSAICAQVKFSTKSARISFYSSSPLENIEATNKSGVALLDKGNGDLQFSLLMKGFEFRKALMQEHFNSRFVESDKYPRATFKGQVVNNSAVNYTANGNYPVTVKGQLTIHGVTKQVEYPAKLIVQEGKISASSTFNVLLSDYNISIPKMYRDNISKSIKITVAATLEAL
jgi:polyisoprenoid-binding protein YceI